MIKSVCIYFEMTNNKKGAEAPLLTTLIMMTVNRLAQLQKYQCHSILPSKQSRFHHSCQ